jgi:hypothetical protein
MRIGGGDMTLSVSEHAAFYQLGIMSWHHFR